MPLRICKHWGHWPVFKLSSSLHFWLWNISSSNAAKTFSPSQDTHSRSKLKSDFKTICTQSHYEYLSVDCYHLWRQHYKRWYLWLKSQQSWQLYPLYTPFHKAFYVQSTSLAPATKRGNITQYSGLPPDFPLRPLECHTAFSTSQTLGLLHQRLWIQKEVETETELQKPTSSDVLSAWVCRQLVRGRC